MSNTKDPLYSATIRILTPRPPPPPPPGPSNILLLAQSLRDNGVPFVALGGIA